MVGSEDGMDDEPYHGDCRSGTATRIERAGRLTMVPRATARDDPAMGQQRRSTTFSITLPPDMAEAVFQQVKQGHHGSPGAVIRAALQQLLQLDEDGVPLVPPPAPANEPKWKQRGGSRMRSD
jgi:hypothetical protein